jgi:hypothetical protein
MRSILRAALRLYQEVAILPDELTPVSEKIRRNPKYAPYFGACIGAIDGTHVDIVGLREFETAPWRNRKGRTSQNVLGVCNFELQFIYCLAGWEGSAHDMRVLRDALDVHGLRIPEGKYLLGDSGYSSTEYLLAPYKGVRYHLREQRLADRR